MNNHPIVLCHGLFGYGPKEMGALNYWGNGMRVPSPNLRLELSVGPVSSVHDRACEAIAQIKGLKTDYGDNHAMKFGHSRWGKDYTGRGLYPEWSDVFPVHMVGHSMGAYTSRYMQYLLDIDHYHLRSNHRWIRSVVGLSPVLNGSTATYLMGCDENTGLVSSSNLLVKLIELFSLATGSIFDAVYGLDLEHWGFVRGEQETVLEYLKRVGESKMFIGKDNAAYDLTLQGGIEMNIACRTFSDTYYASLATTQTFTGFLSGHSYPQLDMNPMLLATATYMGNKHFETNPLLSTGRHFYNEQWFPNDGAVNVCSQIYPWTNGMHEYKKFEDNIELESFDLAGFFKQDGVWNYQIIEDFDHLDIVMGVQLSQISKQKRIYTNLYKGLASL